MVRDAVRAGDGPPRTAVRRRPRRVPQALRGAGGARAVRARRHGPRRPGAGGYRVAPGRARHPGPGAVGRGRRVPARRARRTPWRGPPAGRGGAPAGLRSLPAGGRARNRCAAGVPLAQARVPRDRAHARGGPGQCHARPAPAGGRPMVTSRLFLTGITCSGRHGATPGEKDEPQDFVVDLDDEVEAGGDELGPTADYRTAIETARATVEGESFDLLESLAKAVAN